MAPKPLYYESHITIDPVFDDRAAELTLLAKLHKFRVAELLMQKRREDTPERSRFDSFMTGRDADEQALMRRMFELIALLRKRGFVVRRAKIEAALFDHHFTNTSETVNGEPGLPNRA